MPKFDSHKEEAPSQHEQNIRSISQGLTNSSFDSNTIRRTQVDPSTLRPADIMMLQRTIGNQAVQRLLKPKREATANTASQSAPAIQRKLNVTSTQLTDSESMTGKFMGFFGMSNDDVFDEMKETLGHYEQATTPNEKLTTLRMLQFFAKQWQDKNAGEVTQGSAKSIIIGRLLTEVLSEIPQVIADIQASGEKVEHDDYINKFNTKSLKYMSAKGFVHGTKVQNWHTDGSTSTQGQNANQLINMHKLTPAEAMAIGIYTAPDYLYMNPTVAKDRNWLKGGLANPELKFEHTSTQTELGGGITDKHLDEATVEGNLHSKFAMKGLSKLPNWAGNTYRGVAFTPADFATKYPAGGTTVFPAFSSTSMDESKSKGFAKRNATNGKIPILLRLHLTKGKDIRKLSAFPSEAEILVLPGATFSITSITNGSNGLKLVDLDQTV